MAANLLLGAVWACRHLPLRLDPNSTQSATPFAVYFITVVAQSFVIGFLYNASGGSLLVAVVAHSAADMFDGLRFAIVDPGWASRSDLYQMAAMVLGAVVVLGTRGRLGLEFMMEQHGPLPLQPPGGRRTGRIAGPPAGTCTSASSWNPHRR